MLTDEQKQEIANRLAAEAPPAPTEETPADAQPKEGGEPAEDKKVETPPSADKVETPSAEAKQPDASGKSEQYVPVDKFVKLRHERNDLRQQLQEAREKAARLEGALQARGSQPAPAKTDGDVLDEILKDIETEGKLEQQGKGTPAEERLAKVEAWLQQQEQRENQALLTNVVTECQKRDPTVPREFLVDRFAEGRTPEQALGMWQQWTNPLRTPPATQTPAAPQAKPESRAAPPPPPTVPRAPQGASNSKPVEWRDVSKAVRGALTIR